MPGLDWLTARPVTHRGLHDAASGVIENTPSAFQAALAANYAIECDLRLSADGEVMVVHDENLDRLTHATGDVAAMTAADLKRVAFKATTDHMMTLGELCDLVAGRVTLVLEMKSRFDANARLPVRVGAVLQAYAGPVAVMSFDPHQVGALAAAAPGLPRGIVAERHYRHPAWDGLKATDKLVMAHLLHMVRTQPHFVAYAVHDLPALAPLLARHLFGLPLLTWTVRDEADRKRARRWASQMIFEGFRP